MNKKLCVECHKKWRNGYIEFASKSQVRLTREGVEECDVCGLIDPIPVTPGELHEVFENIFGE